ncbi:MAG: hypothetical protein Q8R15_03295 [Candidatus Micrarchaeota archaeon]|nr:hypothetical protein [Candidatus Micrarchaeota archaeon]
MSEAKASKGVICTSEAEVSKGIICSIEPSRRSSKQIDLWFHLRLGTGRKPGDKTTIFIPLPERKARQFQRHFWIHPAGYGSLSVKKKSIQWIRFYPFGHRETPALRGTRIGELVHHAIVEHLADNYPNRTIRHSESEAILHARRKQLEKMKIDPDKVYKIEAYRQLVRTHMEKRFGMKFES